MVYVDPRQAYTSMGLYGFQPFAYTSIGLIQYSPGEVPPETPRGRIVKAELKDRTIVVGEDHA